MLKTTAGSLFRKPLFASLLGVSLAFTAPQLAFAQAPVNSSEKTFIQENYEKLEFQIPMRDGVKLYTVVYVPKHKVGEKHPILLSRTPYSVGPYEKDALKASLGPSSLFLEEAYIFAYQDVRGKFLSEGDFVNTRPHIAQKKNKKEIDESTDTYDTIDWLVKNIKGNNGNVGTWGISYPGFYATQSILSNHPALKAVSPQAPVTDWFVGDDITHNGAFFLGNFLFFSSFGKDRPVPTTKGASRLDIGTQDGYQFFLRAATFDTLNHKYYGDSIAVWKDFMKHGTYDEFWQSRSPLPHLKQVKPAVLTVGGWYDAEDLYGPLKTFETINKNGFSSYNGMVMGPWPHGGWARSAGNSFGHFQFESNTGEYYREHIELPFFNFYLKGKQPDRQLANAYIFYTGANTWKEYAQWPPQEAEQRKLYLHNDGKVSFTPPSNSATSYDEYVTDPNKPVPHTNEIRPNPGREYMIEDQRFAAFRPDVLTYTSDILEEDVTLAGPLFPNLHISSTGTDTDFVVKLIDAYPDTASNYKDTPANIKLSEYQRLVRADVLRAKFRNSLTHPEPLVANAITPIRFELQDVAHTFKKGHRIVIQVQSTWFPLVDRNPNKFLDIYKAVPSDYVKATNRVYTDTQHPSFIEVGVVQTPTAR